MITKKVIGVYCLELTGIDPPPGCIVVNIGKTKDLAKRLAHHNKGSTYGRWMFRGWFVTTEDIDELTALETYHLNIFGMWRQGQTQQFWIDDEGQQVLTGFPTIRPLSGTTVSLHKPRDSTPRHHYVDLVLWAMFKLGALPHSSNDVSTQTIVHRVVDRMRDLHMLKPGDLDLVDTKASRETRASKHVSWVIQDILYQERKVYTIRGTSKLTEDGVNHIVRKNIVSEQEQIDVMKLHRSIIERRKPPLVYVSLSDRINGHA